VSTRRARIALYGAGGAAFHHAAVFARAGHDVEFVFPDDVRAGALEGFDAFLMPGGGYRAMFGQIEPLGVEGARALKEYVFGGGMYIGCCAGSYDGATVAETFLELCPAQSEMCMLDFKVWNEGGKEWGLQSPGIGVLLAETVAADHPVMAGMPARFELAHYNGPLFFGGSGVELARVVGRTDRFTAWEEVLGERVPEALIDRAANEGIANIVAGPSGEGRTVLFGSHPEFGFTIAMEDEQQPGRMLVNAIEWQLAENPAERPETEVFAQREAAAADTDPARVSELVARLHEQTAAIRAKGTTARWLDREFALGFFGLAPQQIWTASLDAIDRLADVVDQRAPGTEQRVLGFRPDPSWELDGGYHGVVPLLEQSVQLLDQTLETWGFDPGEPTGNAYAGIIDNPYHLVAGSYLAAVGRVSGAALLTEAYQRVPA
jgi:glutamine amidotransferase-like uncharacterized protein